MNLNLNLNFNLNLNQLHHILNSISTSYAAYLNLNLNLSERSDGS